MSRFNEIARIYDHRLPQLRSPEVWEQTLRMTSSFWRLNFCKAMLLTLQNQKAEKARNSTALSLLAKTSPALAREDKSYLNQTNYSFQNCRSVHRVDISVTV